jgi:hypothetical protein
MAPAAHHGDRSSPAALHTFRMRVSDKSSLFDGATSGDCCSDSSAARHDRFADDETAVCAGGVTYRNR